MISPSPESPFFPERNLLQKKKKQSVDNIWIYTYQNYKHINSQTSHWRGN